MWKHFCGIVLLSLFHIGSSAAHFPVQVYATFIDSRGLVWLGTETGLILYQGNKLIHYDHNAADSLSISAGIIYSIAEDEYGNIWAANFSHGLTIFNPERNYYFNVSAKTHPRYFAGINTFNNIQRKSQSEMLISTNRGAYIMNTRYFYLRSVLPVQYRKEEVLAYKFMGKHHYYLLRDKGLLQIDIHGNATLITAKNLPVNALGLSIVHNQLFVSGFSGIFEVQNQQLKKIPVFFQNNEISPDGVNEMLEDKYHNLYINSIKYGMLRASRNPDEFLCEAIDKSNWYQEGNSLYSNYYDSSGHRFFVGTQQGLFVLHDKKEYFFDMVPKENHIGTIRCLLYRENSILAGTEGGVYLLSKELKKMQQNKFQRKAVVTNLFQTSDHKLYGAGYQFYSLETNGLKPDFIFSSLISPDENGVLANNLNDSTIYIIANHSKKIFFWNHLRNAFTYDTLPPSALLVPPTCLYQGNILLASLNGLYLYHVSQKKIEKITQSSDALIADLKVYNDCVYYASATKGITILDKYFSLIRNINISSLAQTNDVRSIAVHDSVIWFSSANGIGYYNLRGNKLAYFKTGVLFKTGNFLHSSVTYHHDTVYFGGDNGIVAVNTKAILQQNEISKCYLVDISVYEKGNLRKVSAPLCHNFSHNENNIEIRLVHASSDFSVFKHYKYELNNNSEIPVDENGMIKLYNLSPDSYTLKVREIESGKLVCSYAFKVLPPWFQTLWFKVVLALLILANSFWISRLYFRRRLIAQQKELEKQVALQTERDRISNDMHDDLGSGLSSIKLISEMLKIKYTDAETVSDLNEIVAHASSLTDTMREMVWSLNPRNDVLPRFVDHTVQYAKHFFDPSPVRFKVMSAQQFPEKSMSSFVRRNLFLCVKEILNNIIKHAGATEVTCTIAYEQNHLVITVRDDGKGVSENHMTGNGLYSLRKRVADCAGTISWKNLNPGFETHIEIPV